MEGGCYLNLQHGDPIPCDRLHRVAVDANLAADQVQTGQDGGELGAEHPAEGDHHSAGDEQSTALEAKRYGSGQR